MKARLATAALIIPIALAGCTDAHPPRRHATNVTVLAASSLTEVFPKIEAQFSKEHPQVTFTSSFNGTDKLVAQIQEGAPADVFAGASTSYAHELRAWGLIESYKAFCTNRLVVVTPASNPGQIESLRDLTKSGVKLVIGSDSVPIGSYTRTVLGRLDQTFGPTYSRDVLSNVVSNENSATSIVAKVQAAEADAGFVYVTDARTAGAQVNTIPLPARAQPTAEYPIAVVSASDNREIARRFVDFVLGRSAQRLLRDAGFGPLLSR